MTKQVSSLADVLAALPGVQDAVRAEIASRIAAGEFIARVEGDKVVSQTPPVRDLGKRRKEITEKYRSAGSGKGEPERKSAA